MSYAKSDMLALIRSALGRGPLDPPALDALAARLEAHRRNLVPARAASLDAAARLELFVAMAKAADATVTNVADDAAIPDAVARYLAERNLPARLVMTPDPGLAEIPWGNAAMLEIRNGLAAGDEAVGVTGCLAAVAETGTLALASGPASPTRNNFLPDTHIVVLRRADVVGIYEEVWDRLRARAGGDGTFMPRTVNFITGPSRTGDIAQKLELGAHGPRRLHIVLVGDGSPS